MTKTRAKRKSHKCDNCRKLKIACDRVRPSCEYCVATNRTCVYEADSLVFASDLNATSESSIDPSPTSSDGIENYLVFYPINDMVNQLSISRFELKLMKFFNDSYLPSLIEKRQMDVNVKFQIPYTWTISRVLRQTVYSLSCLVLYNLDDRGKKYLREDIEGEMSDQELYFKTMDYFNQCLPLHQKSVDLLGAGTPTVQSVDHALEMVLSSVLLYTFLILQPFNVLPLVCNEGGPDLLSMIKGMKLYMGPSFAMLAHTRFSSLSSLCGKSDFYYVNCIEEFFLTQHLRDQLVSIQGQYEFSMYLALEKSIDTLRGSLNNLIRYRNASCLYSWIFCMDQEVIELMRDGDYFGLKLLFYYSCFIIWCGLSDRPEMILLFCNQFKDYNFQHFGGWFDELDFYSYTLCLKPYQFPPESLELWEWFNPKSVVLKEFGSSDAAQDTESTNSTSSSGTPSFRVEASVESFQIPDNLTIEHDLGMIPIL